MYSFCAMNSFRMSFWIVPERFSHEMPCRSATTRYIANIIAAGALVVIDVVISSSRIPSNNASMSANEVMFTPHFPTSPTANGWSASRPISEGRSNATLKPVAPAASRSR
jgi:hypothetical protein